ncbi:glycosyltransferase family 4 protein [Prevotella sp. P6B4]|uniref:glycosyltransferase family 4 protein n=1 Tax=Prevotella sp. P6B4 TaxID=1410614 RepID=UPI000AFEAFD3|nr:glycosyltransferase family 4 protein [Prevotella sp. P6B4]
MKVIVAHPGKQHSFRLASAMQKAGLLHSYVTEIYDKKSSVMMKFIKKLLNKSNLKRANAHYNPDLKESQVVQFCEFGGFIELLLNRLDKSMKLYRRFSSYNTDRFGLKLAKYAIKNDVDMVIGYDADSTICFKYLKEHAPHIIRVLDVSIAARPYMKDLFQKEVTQSGLTYAKDENIYLWQRPLERYYSEIRDADYFFVASDFVRDSLLYCGVESNRILKVPYGANISSDILIKEANPTTPLIIQFVGQTNARKGMPLLLDCISSMDSNRFQLVVTGGYNPQSPYIAKHLDDENIKFTGFVTHDQMQKIYEDADIFVLTSIAEGMALVGIEAMACGLPVICTYGSGLSDLIIEGETGFVVPYGDETALKEKLEWFYVHKDRIKTMGERARQVAMEFSWKKYEENIVKIVLKINELNNKQ